MVKSKKILAIAETKEQVKAILVQESKLGKSTQILLLMFDDSIKLTKTHRGIHYISSTKYLSPEIFHDIVQNARSIAMEWHKSISEDWSHNGINLGWIIETPFFKDVADIIQRIVVIQQVLNEYKPDKIIVADDGSMTPRTAILVANSKDIKSIRIKLPLFGAKRGTHTCFHFLRKTVRNIVLSVKYKADSKRYKKDRPKVMPIIFEQHHENILGSVLKEIEIRGNLEPFSVCFYPGATEQSLQNDEIEYVLLNSLMSIDVALKTSLEIVKLKMKWDALTRDTHFRTYFTYDGIVFWSLIVDLFNNRYDTYYSDIIGIIEIIKDALAKKSIELVILMGDSCVPERAIIGAADSNSIPSLIVQHGVMADTWGYVPLHGTKMAVFGEFSKKFMIEHGTDSDRVIVTGSPIYDALIMKKDFSHEDEIYKQLGLDKSNEIIVLATQGLVEHKLGSLGDWKILVSNVMEAMKMFPDKQLVIKLHPHEKEDKYYKFFPLMKNVTIIKDIDIHSLFRVSKILLTESSTVGLDSMIQGIPVITINFTGRPDIIPYASSGAAIGVKNQDELIEAIKKILYDEDTTRKLHSNMKQFVFDYAYKMDGHAYKRIVDLIEKMVAKSKKEKEP